MTHMEGWTLQPQHIWWLVGLALLLTELGSPGLTLLFFGIGAVVTGFVCWIAPIGLTAQVWIFLSVSILSLVALRRSLRRVFQGRRRNGSTADLPDACIGQRVRVTETIAPDQPGRVELNGTGWKAEAETTIPAGSRVEIVGRDALTLRVQPLPSNQTTELDARV